MGSFEEAATCPRCGLFMPIHHVGEYLPSRPPFAPHRQYALPVNVVVCRLSHLTPLVILLGWYILPSWK